MSISRTSLQLRFPRAIRYLAEWLRARTPLGGQANVTVYLTGINGARRLVYTDAAGMYAFSYLAAGTYTITPESCPLFFSCASFTPPSRTIPITNVNATGQDFVLGVP